jgi:hypothetical protein
MRIKATIEGVTPLLCNRFTEAAQTSNGTSAAFKSGKKGTPREQCEPKLYQSEEGEKGVPASNVLAALVNAGKYIKVGKRTLTTAKSSHVPAGLQMTDLFLPLTPQSWEVDSRSVVIPATGGRIMCHRPRFDKWSLSFDLDVEDSMFSDDIVRQLMDEAGSKVGLGDWRPERRGPFGRFKVTRWVKEK